MKNLIYGCMGLGGNPSGSVIDKETRNHAFAALDMAYDSGITIFDNADIYNGGRAEKVFGLWLKENPDMREKIIIQSKTGIKLHAGPHASSYYDFSESYIRQQVEGILDRLQVSYLDMLLLHRPDVLAQPEELAEVLNKLEQQGKVRSFGVSNMSVAQIQWLEHSTGISFRANQIQFSLGHSFLVDETAFVNTGTPMDQGLNGMLYYAMTKGMELQAWSPLDKGRFLSIHPDSTPSEKQTTVYLNQLAEKYNSTPGAVALNWVMKLPAAIAPVIGSTTPSRIKSLARTLDFEITRDEWYSLWVSARGNKLP